MMFLEGFLLIEYLSILTDIQHCITFINYDKPGSGKLSWLHPPSSYHQVVLVELDEGSNLLEYHA